MRKLIRLVLKYIQYPNEFYTAVNMLKNRGKAKRLGIRFLEPNYIFKDNLNQTSTIIDVGCGYQAELAQFFINTYQVKAYIIDPTQKHKAALEELVEKYGTTLIYLGYAVSSNDGEIEFYETLDHESGSLFDDHLNIRRDTIRKYKVKSITLHTLLKEINAKTIDYIKLDLEGAEYELIESLTREIAEPFKQIFIEFHHHAFKRISRSMTRRAVKHLKKLGFKAFTLDTNNYLFYQN